MKKQRNKKNGIKRFLLSAYEGYSFIQFKVPLSERMIAERTNIATIFKCD